MEEANKDKLPGLRTTWKELGEGVGIHGTFKRHAIGAQVVTGSQLSLCRGPLRRQNESARADG